MKTAIVILFVAACIAISFSARVPSASKPQKWTEITAKINEIKAQRSQSGEIAPKSDWLTVSLLFIVLSVYPSWLYENIDKVIVNVDQSIKDRIATKIDISADEIYPILDGGLGLVNSQELSRKNATDLFDNQLVDALKGFSNNLESELGQLSDELASIIRNLIAINNIRIIDLNQYIHLYLDVVRRDIAVGVDNVQNHVLSNLEEIKTVANSDNEQVGANIATSLNKMAEDQLEYYDTIVGQISQGSVTEYETNWYFRNIRLNYLQLPDLILDDLLQLNVTTSAQIVNLVKAGIEGLDKKGVELTKLVMQGEF